MLPLDYLEGSARCAPAQGDAASWISRITERREEYKRLFQQYKTDPNAMEDVDPLLNNPLSTEAESPWTNSYAEQELIETIHKDVNRLYPNGCESFFEKPEIQNIMTNVLFFCGVRCIQRHHTGRACTSCWPPSSGSWKWNGWHRTNSSDAVDPASEDASLLRVLLDPVYIEHDSFWCLQAILRDMESMFLVHAVNSKNLAQQHRSAQARYKLAAATWKV